MGIGVNLIKAERDRQQYIEGWTEEHDNKHVNNELALAAACYAVPDIFLKDIGLLHGILVGINQLQELETLLKQEL